MEKITADSVLEIFKQAVENDIQVSQAQWLDGAAKLVILTEGLDDELSRMKFLMADAERKAVEAGEPGIKAKMLKIGAIDYEKYLKLKAKRKRIDEHIRIAKKRERHPDF